MIKTLYIKNNKIKNNSKKIQNWTTEKNSKQDHILLFSINYIKL